MVATLFLFISLAFGVSLTRWIGIKLNAFEFGAFSVILGLFAFAWIMLLPSIPFPYKASLPIGAIAMVAFGTKLWLLGETKPLVKLKPSSLASWSVVTVLSGIFWLDLMWSHDLNPVKGGTELESANSTWADFGLHANLVTHQAYSNHLPSDMPVASGTKLTYPFLVDFDSAVFLREGWSLHMAFTIPGALLAWALTLLLIGFGKRLFGSFSGGVIGTALTMCAGAYEGITRMLDSIDASHKGAFDWFKAVPDNFAGNWEHNAQFFNPVADLLLPQRAFLFGLGIFLIIAILWHRVIVGADLADELAPSDVSAADRGKGAGGKGAGGKGAGGKGSRPASGLSAPQRGVKARVKNDRQAVEVTSSLPVWLPTWAAPWFPGDTVARRSLLTGAALFGLLPMAHAHSFVVVGFLFAGLATWIVAKRRQDVRAWAVAAAMAVVLALPQIAWQQLAVPNGTGGHSMSGWSRGPNDSFWDPLGRNFGFFLIVMVGIVVLLCFKQWRPWLPWLAPFGALFAVAQFYSLQPLEYDNLKLLFYVYLMGALTLGGLIGRIHVVARPFVVAIAVGCLSIGGVATIVREFQTHNTFAPAADLQLADWVKKNTKPNAVFAGKPWVIGAPGTLGGRILVMAYPGWLTNYNLDTSPRDAAIKALFQGKVDDPNVQKYSPDYLFVSKYPDPSYPVDAEALKKLNQVYDNSDWTVYKLK